MAAFEKRRFLDTTEAEKQSPYLIEGGSEKGFSTCFTSFLASWRMTFGTTKIFDDVGRASEAAEAAAEKSPISVEGFYYSGANIL